MRERCELREIENDGLGACACGARRVTDTAMGSAGRDSEQHLGPLKRRWNLRFEDEVCRMARPDRDAVAHLAGSPIGAQRSAPRPGALL